MSVPLGFESALGVVTRGRAAFFRSEGDDLPVAESDQIASDDRLPQFGYVGSNYARRRILMLGINPGNGPRTHRSSGDEIALPALELFARLRTAESFASAQKAYRSVCEGWAIWGRQCYELLTAAGLDLEDVAFTNALPWRTRSKSAFSARAAAAAAEIYVQPVVEELGPKIIVAVGKRADEILASSGHMSERVVVWNREQALRPSVIADRENAARKFAQLVFQVA